MRVSKIGCGEGAETEREREKEKEDKEIARQSWGEAARKRKQHRESVAKSTMINTILKKIYKKDIFIYYILAQ